MSYSGTIGESQMREQRKPLDGPVTCRYSEPVDEAVATWLDVSRAGAGIRLGRYLRPGRMVTLGFSSPLDPDERVEIPARVVWCRQVPESTEFTAGLQLRRDNPEAAVAFSALGQRAQAEKDAANAKVPTKLWSLGVAAMDMQPDAGAGIAQAV